MDWTGFNYVVSIALVLFDISFLIFNICITVFIFRNVRTLPKMQRFLLYAVPAVLWGVLLFSLIFLNHLQIIYRCLILPMIERFLG